MVSLIARNIDTEPSPENLHLFIKLKTGCTVKIGTKDGIVEVPDSIAFASMDQTQFEAFYEKAVAFILSDIMPGLDRQDLDEQLLEMMSPPDER